MVDPLVSVSNYYLVNSKQASGGARIVHLRKREGGRHPVFARGKLVPFSRSNFHTSFKLNSFCIVHNIVYIL